MARAASSLPVPVSPSKRTVASTCAAFSSSAYTSRMGALRPTRLWNESCSPGAAARRAASAIRLCSAARATTPSAASGSNGFSR
jgi:hypothetical protein